VFFKTTFMITFRRATPRSGKEWKWVSKSQTSSLHYHPYQFLPFPSNRV